MFDYESIFHAKRYIFFDRVCFENGTFFHHCPMFNSSIGDIQIVIFRAKMAIFENVSVIYSVLSMPRYIYTVIEILNKKIGIKSKLFKYFELHQI